MRKKIIAGNWKMNMVLAEATEFVEQCSNYFSEHEISQSVPIICPAFLFVQAAKNISQDYLKIGAQNVSEHEKGAFTGEISAAMLASIPVDYCIIGHSERRKLYHETDSIVNKKLLQLLSHKIKPIICVGETLEEREAGITKRIITSQLNGAFENINITSEMIIAYEPVWAIGTGKTATPEQAQEIHSFIRNWLSNNTEKGLAEQIHILYGGSVKPANIKSLLQQDDIDGGLIGGAALKYSSFIEMIEIAESLT